MMTSSTSPTLGLPARVRAGGCGGLSRRAAIGLVWLWATASAQAGFDQDLTELRQDWEVTHYQTPRQERLRRHESLAAKAHQTSEQYAGRAEALAWEGVIVADWADAQGGFAAITLRQRARRLFEAALKLDEHTQDGLALDGLAMLYLHSLPWPLGFRDQRKAGELLLKALAIHPRGLDTNFFYGAYLIETDQPEDAALHLERALQASDRPGRRVADIGRREEARALLARARQAIAARRP